MIEIRSRALTASIVTRGAALAGLWHSGCKNSLVLGAPSAEAYDRELTYFGAIVGPVANRISGACVNIDNQIWKMQANEGQTSLHSGDDGLHAQDWEVVDRSGNHVELACKLHHGACGLPGNRELSVKYQVTDHGTLELELSATTDQTTLMNLAHHPYWNLDGRPTIAEHELQIFADTYLPVDERTLPIGEICSVPGTDFDFTSTRRVPTDTNLDANLCLRRSKQKAPQKSAILSVPTGLRMQIETTETGLQLYNGNGLHPVSAALHDQRVLGPCAGVALEPQGWPDAPNNANFPSILLLNTAPYQQITIYRFTA